MAAVDFFIAFFIYFAPMAFYAVVPGWNFFLLPFLIFATMVCALGISMFLAALISLSILSSHIGQTPERSNNILDAANEM